MNYNLTIGHLYPDLMNIYGDLGNIITIKKRCQWRGIKVEIKNVSIGDKLKTGEIDLYFFGGGQDASQIPVAQDLLKKANVIKKDLIKGIPCLAICGGYQLLGNSYEPQKGSKIQGLGLFDITTRAGEKRMIGNISVATEEFGTLIGFENHSGITYLGKASSRLGNVKKGFGNNGEDNGEGYRFKNSIGCYMHGSLLPKNPKLADWLIKKALEIKYGREIILEPLDDELEIKAHDFALKL